MRNSAILSGLLHGFVILLLFIGLPDIFRRDLEPPPIIPIEVINIADVTQASALKVKPKENGPKEEPKEKPEPPKPPPVEEKTPEPEPEPEKKPDPEPELTMDDLLAPVEEEKPKEEKPKEEKPKEKKKDKPKKKKKDKPKKKKQKNFMSLLNNIEKTESSSDGPTQPEQDENSTADQAANNIGELSITELDLIRRQLQQCWNVPAGAKDGKDLNVDIKLEINPDATVRSAVVIKTSKPISNPHMRALAESAKRAVQNPKCSPLKLPLDRYDQWKTVTIGFNPKNML